MERPFQIKPRHAYTANPSTQLPGVLCNTGDRFEFKSQQSNMEQSDELADKYTIVHEYCTAGYDTGSGRLAVTAALSETVAI